MKVVGWIWVALLLWIWHAVPSVAAPGAGYEFDSNPQANAMVKQATTLNEQKRFPEAILCCKQALSLSRHCKEAYAQLGKACASLSDSTGCIAAWTEFLKLSPKNGYIRCKLAEVYSENNQYASAIEQYNYLLAIFPHDSTLLHKRALIYCSLRQYENAFSDWGKGIEAFHRADAYDQLGKHDLAKKQREKAKQTAEDFGG